MATVNGANAVLSLLVVAAACFAGASWFSPKMLSWLSVRLMTRIDVIRSSRQAHVDGIAHWEKKLGVPEYQQ